MFIVLTYELWFYTFYCEIVIRMATIKQIYYRSAQGLQGSSTTAGHGFIWLENPQCTGSETSLAKCKSSFEIGVHNCRHTEDARAVCQN